MDTWFTSDLHFGHRNIINYCRRPFHSVENMNKLLVMNWNELVRPDDTVYVLGDFAMGQIQETLPLGRRLHGNKVLVAGNHDRCWSGHGEKAKKWIDVYRRDAGFEEVHTTLALEIDGLDRPVHLNHFPFTGDSHDVDRYEDSRPEDRGQVLFHGHIHTGWKQCPDNPRMINVGVDVWGYTPVRVEHLVALVKGS